MVLKSPGSIDKLGRHGQANDYRDARNVLLDRLGSYINYKQIEERDGTIVLARSINWDATDTNSVRATISCGFSCRLAMAFHSPSKLWVIYLQVLIQAYRDYIQRRIL